MCISFNFITVDYVWQTPVIMNLTLGYNAVYKMGDGQDYIITTHKDYFNICQRCLVLIVFQRWF